MTTQPVSDPRRNPILVRVFHGRVTGTIPGLLSRLLTCGTEILWCEPRPSKWPLGGFPAIWLHPPAGVLEAYGGAVSWDEARLFAGGDVLHLVRNGPATRYALFQTGARPATAASSRWLEHLDSPAESIWPLLPLESQDVLLQQAADLNRFGLTDRLPNPTPLGSSAPMSATPFAHRGRTVLFTLNVKDEG